MSLRNCFDLCPESQPFFPFSLRQLCQLVFVADAGQIAVVGQDVECFAGEGEVWRVGRDCRGRPRGGRRGRRDDLGARIVLGAKPVEALGTPPGTFDIVETDVVLRKCRSGAGLCCGDRGVEAVLGFQVVG